MNDVVEVNNRVSRLEQAIVSGLERIEKLLRQEITDLKTEQIRDLKEANTRLADDQRRLWESVESLRRDRDERLGSSKVIFGIGHFMSAGFGGLTAWMATWLTSGKPPHP